MDALQLRARGGARRGRRVRLAARLPVPLPPARRHHARVVGQHGVDEHERRDGDSVHACPPELDVWPGAVVMKCSRHRARMNSDSLVSYLYFLCCTGIAAAFTSSPRATSPDISLFA